MSPRSRSLTPVSFGSSRVPSPRRSPIFGVRLRRVGRSGQSPLSARRNRMSMNTFPPNAQRLAHRLATAYQKKYDIGFKINNGRIRGVNKAYINRLVERRAGVNQQIKNIKRNINNRGLEGRAINMAALIWSHRGVRQ